MPGIPRSTLRAVGALLGLVILLSVALVAAAVILSAIMAREAVRPPRHTAGYAVALGLPVDPKELGLEFDEWTLEVPGAATLPVWEVRSGQESGVRGQRSAAESRQSSLTAVFIHDWGESRIDVLARIEPWRTLCDRFVLYDLRGHGEATGGGSRLGHREDLDLLALLDRLGDCPIVLVGQSMGAIIAISAAASNNPVVERIAGVVAYGPSRDFHSSLRGRLHAGGYPTRPLTDLAIFWLRFAGTRPKGLPDEEIQRVRCPILIICGADDAIVSVSHGQRIAEAATHGTLLVIPNGGHLDAHIADPQHHDQALRVFVERVQDAVN
ncbi:MAG: alpha/beta hydrolase [Planctomycetota bacterium]|nr:alpha/beta hydrolase [Planctomycetota bacterium]